MTTSIETNRMSDPAIAEPEDRKPPVEDFTWTAPDGRTVTFKPFGRLPVGVFRKVGQLDDMNATFALLEAGTDEAGLAVLDEQPIGELEDIISDWTAASGVNTPE